MTTRIISLHDFDDDDPLPPPAPLPVAATLPGSPAAPARLGGMLAFDDGTVVVVNATTVLGRDPARDPQVSAGEVTGVALAGADFVLSRIHAELRVSIDGVELVDRRSTNGTFVQRPGSKEWQRVDPQHPVPLDEGDRISFGGLICRFEAMDDSPLR